MSGPRRDGVYRGVVPLILYYVVATLVIVALSRVFPLIEEAFTLDRLRQLSGIDSEITATFSGNPPSSIATSVWEHSDLVIVGVSVVGTIIVMIPVAWSYIIVKRPGDYLQSVVHTLIILPVAISGIVIIVQNSLALAFSLAGIVAAVRFRTTLEDVKDAVFVFLAIGVGLSAGVQALGVAAVLSLSFNAINLVLWRLNFGNIYVDQRGRAAGLALGDVLAGPESARGALAIGDRRILAAMTPADMSQVAERVARMERYLESETEVQTDRKHYSVLLVHTDRVSVAQPIVERALADRAARWRLAEILPGIEGVSILEYLVRMREGVFEGALLDQIRSEGGDHVRAAELRSLKGMAKKKR